VIEFVQPNCKQNDENILSCLKKTPNPAAKVEGDPSLLCKLFPYTGYERGSKHGGKVCEIFGEAKQFCTANCFFICGPTVLI
jgi:hypothetical protein